MPEIDADAEIARNAQELEVTDEEFKVKFRDQVWSSRNPYNWPADWPDRLNNGELWGVLRMAFSEEQADDMLSLEPPVSLLDALGLLSAIQKSIGNDLGKIAATWHIVRTYPEHLEADLHATYQVDLLDYWRGRLSLRKLRVLVEHLPTDSHVARAVDVRLSWSTSDYLLANVIDRIAELAWLYVSAHSDKGRRVKRPEPTPRPGESAKVVDAEPVEGKAPGKPYRPRAVPRLNSPEELAAWLRGG